MVAYQPPRFPPCEKRGGGPPLQPPLVAPKSKAAKAVLPHIAALVKGISKKRLETTVTSLTKFATRFTGSPQIDDVTASIMKMLVASGYQEGKDAFFQPFTMPGFAKQRNVICRGGKAGAELALVCAHYDSISEKSSTNAPGADDNASGVAVALEIARIVKASGGAWKRGVMVALFGGEEQGLHGSATCAEIAAAEGLPIAVVVNLDMVGFGSANPPRIRVEYDQGNARPENDADAKVWAARMASAAADYTRLSIEHTDIWNSDYLPFEAKGFTCIGAYDAEDNPNYHLSKDRKATLNFAQMTEVAKMVVATIATWAG